MIHLIRLFCLILSPSVEQCFITSAFTVKVSEYKLSIFPVFIPTVVEPGVLYTISSFVVLVLISFIVPEITNSKKAAMG